MNADYNVYQYISLDRTFDGISEESNSQQI